LSGGGMPIEGKAMLSKLRQSHNLFWNLEIYVAKNIVCGKISKVYIDKNVIKNVNECYYMHIEDDDVVLIITFFHN